MEVQDAVDKLHKRQCAQGNEVGVIRGMVLDLRDKMEEIESKMVKSNRPIYINVNPEGLD